MSFLENLLNSSGSFTVIDNVKSKSMNVTWDVEYIDELFIGISDEELARLKSEAWRCWRYLNPINPPDNHGDKQFHEHRLTKRREAFEEYWESNWDLKQA